MDANCVHKFNKNLEYEGKASTEKIIGPHSVSFDNDNNFYVTEYHGKRIQKFSREGKLLQVIGDKFLTGPATTTISQDNHLWTAEYTQNCILKISKDGMTVVDKFIGFDRPHMAKIGPDGMVYIADTWNHRVVRMSTNGGDRACLESDKWSDDKIMSESSEPKRFNGPVALDFNSNNDILVTDWGNSRLQIFNKSGKLLKVIGNSKNLFKNPYDAVFHYNKIFVADTHNHCVKILEQK